MAPNSHRPRRATLSIKSQNRGLIETHLLQQLPPELEQIPIVLSPDLLRHLSNEQQARFEQLAPCIVRVVEDPS